MRRAPAPTEQGLTLVEVLVALAVLAIVMPALAAATFSTLRATQLNDQRTVATNLAQAEVEGVRATDFSDLIGDLGRVTRTVASAGTTYVIARDTTWAGIDSSADPCASSGVSAATALARIDVEVWPQGHEDRIARSSTTVARPSGDVDDPTRGALGVQVSDHRDPPVGVAGAIVTVSRGSPNPVNQLRTTPASGCVVFSGLPAGDYTVEVRKPGYVGRTVGDGDTLTRTATVVAGELQVPPAVRLAPAATVTFAAAPRFGDSVAMPSALPVTMLRDGAYVRAEVGAALGPLWPGLWDVWAGDCGPADPLAWPDGVRSVEALEPGARSIVVEVGVVRLVLPASETVPVTWPVTITAEASGCDDDETNRFTIPGVGPTDGSITVEPSAIDLGLPYGTWALTVDDAAGRTMTVADVALAPTATDAVLVVADAGGPP